MTFSEAMEIACRHHEERLPELLFQYKEWFEHICRMHKPRHGASAGTPEDQANAAIACTQWMLAKLRKLAPDFECSPYGIEATAYHAAHAECVFPYDCADREPIGNKYLFTICIHGAFVGNQLIGIIRHACELFRESQQGAQRHEEPVAANS